MSTIRTINGCAIFVLAALFTVGHCIRITKLNVPSYHIINEAAAGELVLDCEYELPVEDEAGFVLKWLHNEQLVYQWILNGHRRHSLTIMKNRIDLNYTASTDEKHKYRALAIVSPTMNMTGTYTCHASSFRSEDKRSANLTMIRKESQLRVQLEDSRDDPTTRKVQCIATDVYPEPNVTMYLNDKEIKDFPKSSKLNETDGLFDVVLFGNIAKDDIDSPSSVQCVLSIAGTNYSSRAEGKAFSNGLRPALAPQLTAIWGILAITYVLMKIG